MIINKNCYLQLVFFLFSTNIFAGLTSPTIGVAGIAEDKNTNPASSDVSNIDYIKAVKESSVEMLIKASAKYKKGTITKDQYIQVALQVSQMAEYYQKIKMPNEGNGQKANNKAAANVNNTPAAITAVAVPAKVESCSVGEIFSTYTNACFPCSTVGNGYIPNAEKNDCVKAAVDNTPTAATTTPAAPPISSPAADVTTYDQNTKKVIQCSSNDALKKCQPGFYRNRFSFGERSDPIITTKPHIYLLSGERAILQWTVSAPDPVNCQLEQVVATDLSTIVIMSFNGSDSYQTPPVTKDHTYYLKCRYIDDAPLGQLGFADVSINMVDAGSSFLGNPNTAAATSNVFNKKCYLERYSDVKSYLDANPQYTALEHWTLHGSKEHRIPGCN